MRQVGDMREIEEWPALPKSLRSSMAEEPTKAEVNMRVNVFFFYIAK